MKKLFLTLFVVCAISSAQASKANTYHVDSSGSVTVGASRFTEKDFDIQCSNFNRKPTRAEISDVDPRQLNSKKFK